MKLLFCEKCWDVFKLDYELRQCKCGEVKGYYEKNGHNAVTNGKGVSMAVNNHLVLPQIAAMRDRELVIKRGGGDQYIYDDYYEDCRIPFWVRPNSGTGNPRSIIKEDI